MKVEIKKAISVFGGHCGDYNLLDDELVICYKCKHNNSIYYDKVTDLKGNLLLN